MREQTSGQERSYQEISNQICLNFGMNPIPIIFYNREGNRYGFYTGDRIKLNLSNNRLNIDTLLHELAHYLHEYRYQTTRDGYYTIEMLPSIDGKLKLQYFIGLPHGKEFKQCFGEIREASLL